MVVKVDTPVQNSGEVAKYVELKNGQKVMNLSNYNITTSDGVIIPKAPNTICSFMENNCQYPKLRDGQIRGYAGGDFMLHMQDNAKMQFITSALEEGYLVVCEEECLIPPSDWKWVKKYDTLYVLDDDFHPQPYEY